MDDQHLGDLPPERRKIHILGREIAMPRSRMRRVSIGAALIVFGILGFLPVLGFWMIPLGLLILSHEFHLFRRLRRRTIVWWERRKRAKPRN